MTLTQRPVAGLDDAQRQTAMRRWAGCCARTCRKASRWRWPPARPGCRCARRSGGWPATAPTVWSVLPALPVADRGRRRVPAELVRLVEGLALYRPRPSVATITRRVARGATAQGWPVPSYSTVHAIVAELDPHLLTLAHDGPVALRDRYELVYRRQAERPNMIWQADHTELDLLILDANRAPARPWLTIVEDDCSRAVAGYTVFLGAPSSLNLSLALRQAIWRKTDPGWAVHGIPDVLYADHGSDFTSDHLAQVAADLHIELVHSTVGRPQGRGNWSGCSARSPPSCSRSCPGTSSTGNLRARRRSHCPNSTPPSVGGSPPSTTSDRTAKPGSRPSRRGSATAGCPAPPTASKTSTCCWSWSPPRGSCTATASDSRAFATSTRPWPPTSGNR